MQLAVSNLGCSSQVISDRCPQSSSHASPAPRTHASRASSVSVMAELRKRPPKGSSDGLPAVDGQSRESDKLAAVGLSDGILLLKVEKSKVREYLMLLGWIVLLYTALVSHAAAVVSPCPRPRYHLIDGESHLSLARSCSMPFS
jgi:hypothetical protein